MRADLQAPRIKRVPDHTIAHVPARYFIVIAPGGYVAGTVRDEHIAQRFLKELQVQQKDIVARIDSGFNYAPVMSLIEWAFESALDWESLDPDRRRWAHELSKEALRQGFLIAAAQFYELVWGGFHGRHHTKPDDAVALELAITQHMRSRYLASLNSSTPL